MQTNTLRIDSCDSLYTMFTTLEPEDRRMAVLRAIVDQGMKIGHSWEDCLFAVAARATNPSIQSVNSEIAARVLGVPLKWVEDGVRVWDGRRLDKLVKKEFMERIRVYIEGFEKGREIADEAVREVRQATRFVEKVKRSFSRELTHV